MNCHFLVLKIRSATAGRSIQCSGRIESNGVGKSVHDDVWLLVSCVTFFELLITYIFLLLAEVLIFSWRVATDDDDDHHHHQQQQHHRRFNETSRVSNQTKCSTLIDVVRVQIGTEFPVIDDSIRDVDMGPTTAC